MIKGILIGILAVLIIAVVIGISRKKTYTKKVEMRKKERHQNDEVIKEDFRIIREAYLEYSQLGLINEKKEVLNGLS